MGVRAVHTKRKEMRSIICNAQSVQGILDESKTATRRVIVPQPQSQGMKEYGEAWEWHRSKKDWFSGATLEQLKAPIGLRQYSPYGLPGDKLWVKETFKHWYFGKDGINAPGIMYKADGKMLWNTQANDISDKKWRSSGFMPKRFSRIILKIEELRVERVQDISVYDARLEGLQATNRERMWSTPFAHPEQNKFKTLWDSINLKRGYGWDFNPWVWVIIFSLDSVGRYIK